jgi:hypothetical protein
MHYQVTTQIQILVLGSNQRFGSIQVSWQCLETYEFGGLIQGVANHSVTTSLDKTPPTVTCQATPSTLWPPNGNLVSVTVIVSVTDSGSGPNGYKLVSITSNEGDIAAEQQVFVIGTASNNRQVARGSRQQGNRPRVRADLSRQRCGGQHRHVRREGQGAAPSGALGRLGSGRLNGMVKFHATSGSRARDGRLRQAPGGLGQ